MELQYSTNAKAPLLSWDFFCAKYNCLVEEAMLHRQTVSAIKQIARSNRWTKEQTREAIENTGQYVIVITDHLQRISFTGKGFFEMTGYSFDEAEGRNPKFLQGAATNKKNTGLLKSQLNHNEPTEIILENYRKNGELYLCKIIIKPIVNIHQKLVNYIAYEQEIAA
ncbi:MAG: PAS domain-containing protein [Ferruginibacter sp.]|nr:PAS domain-containing protein [Ferruginibacter sp.]